MSEIASKLSEQDILMMYMSLTMYKYSFPKKTLDWREIWERSGIGVISAEEMETLYHYHRLNLFFDTAQGYMNYLVKKKKHLGVRQGYFNVSPTVLAQSSTPPSAGSEMEETDVEEEISKNRENGSLTSSGRKRKLSMIGVIANGSKLPKTDTPECWRGGTFSWSTHHKHLMKQVLDWALENGKFEKILGWSGAIWKRDIFGALENNLSSEEKQIFNDKYGEEVKRDFIGFMSQRHKGTHPTEPFVGLHFKNESAYAAIALFYYVSDGKAIELPVEWKNKSILPNAVKFLLEKGVLYQPRNEQDWVRWFADHLFNNLDSESFFHTNPYDLSRVRLKLLREAPSCSWYGVQQLEILFAIFNKVGELSL